MKKSAYIGRQSLSAQRVSTAIIADKMGIVNILCDIN